MNRLKELREDHDLLQKDVAKALGISQRNYSYFETGTTALTDDILIKIAKLYKTSIDYILYQTDIRTSYPFSIVDQKELVEQ
ncbi:MAG: helix-turn-helix transcriptional regulator [Firmicutes bacterium]|nr:helix-turn-helix transcriptional regulator [Bacillota bacterium]